MTKILSQLNKVSERGKKIAPYFLDKLEITSHYFQNKSHESQYNKGIAKHQQNAKLNRLIDVKKTDFDYWKKQYQKTYFCNHVLLQDKGKLTGSLCRKRWCKHCNRIKTAELINGYLKPLEALSKDDKLYFVTLTAPTVKARELKSEIRKRLKAFTRIKNNLQQNYKIKLNGYRKIEVTYNDSEDRYHPHMHLIVQGYAESKQLLDLWLKQFDKASVKAQDIREITINDDSKESLKELFKYATKGSVKDSSEAAAEHTIHRALQGTRIYQPYGKVRKVKQPKEATSETTQANWLDEAQEIWVYEQNQKDWVNSSYRTLVGTLEIEKLIYLNHKTKSHAKD